MAKIIGNTTATPSPIGNLSNLKTKNKNSLVDAINEAAESANGDFVSYSQSQDLTDEQKEVARNNIDAVDANLVVSSFLDPSSHPRDVKIPNGAALFEYVAEYTNTSCVRNDVQQKIPAYNQELARSNIGAVSQAEFGSAVIDMVSRNELIGAIAATEATVVSAFEQQNFTDEQKEIARNNIDATGIYIGSGEMPEGYDIQIDTDGDVYSITNRITDDTNTEIPNCEAVKDYIANNITIADDGNGNITLNSSSNKVEFTDDGNGNIKMEVM